MTRTTAQKSAVTSMTGYAIIRRDTPAGRLIVELRSVNSRFLDLSFRMPDDLRHAEPLMRERITAAIARGKVECRVGLHASGAAAAPKVNPDVIAQLAAVEQQVRAALPALAPLTMADVMRWPGVVEQTELSAETWQQLLAECCDAALLDFRASREREGARLVEAIEERVATMRGLVADAQVLLPAALQAHQVKLAERIEQALATLKSPVDPELIADKVRQELTLYGLRTDVSEELTRLTVHLDELQRIVRHGGQVGKKLDFLMQELNREANTLGSKSPTTELSNVSMGLKLQIEQIREQVQNLE